MVPIEDSLPCTFDTQTPEALRTRTEVPSASQIWKAVSATSPNNRSLLCFVAVVVMVSIVCSLLFGFYFTFGYPGEYRRGGLFPIFTEYTFSCQPK